MEDNISEDEFMRKMQSIDRLTSKIRKEEKEKWFDVIIFVDPFTFEVSITRKSQTN